MSAATRAKISAALKARRRGSRGAATTAQRAASRRIIVKRIRAGARRGFFRNTTRVGLRRTNLFRQRTRMPSLVRSR